MKLSKRGEYALRSLINLGIAAKVGRRLVRVTELAKAEDLPVKFLEQVIQQLRGPLSSVAGARTFLQAVQDIRVGGRQSNAQYQFTLLSDSTSDLYKWVPKLTEALQRLPELADVNSDQQQGGLEAMITIDRATAARLNIKPAQIDNTLYDAFGQRQVATFYTQVNQYRVVLEASDASTAGHLGVNAHTDSGALTLLLQDDQPGLEVFHDGAWQLVEPRRDALVVNIGDIVQVWSNDRYTAALHRGLVSANAARFSAPFFFNPAYRTWYAPLLSTVDAGHPARYRPIHWGEFRARRAAGDYADHGEYHSINHYSR